MGDLHATQGVDLKATSGPAQVTRFAAPGSTGVPSGPSPPPQATGPRLLERVRAAIRARHYSPRTEKAYVAWIKRYIFFNETRHPEGMGTAEVTHFLSYLATKGQVSASTQNQAFSALLFLYREVLGRELADLGQVVRAKQPGRLPLVLSPAEVATILRQLQETPWLMASLMYGAGLRLLECARLRVKDVDVARAEIAVRDGKGRKDRVTVLPAGVVQSLKAHLVRIRRQHEMDVMDGAGSVDLPDALHRKYPRAAWEWGWQWVFPATRLHRDRSSGHWRRHHLHESVVQRAFKEAVRAAGVAKPATCHSLRHYPERRIIPTWPPLRRGRAHSPPSGPWRTRDNPGAVSSTRHAAGRGGDTCWKTSSHRLPRSDCGPASSAAISIRSALGSLTSAISARRFGTSCGSSAV